MVALTERFGDSLEAVKAVVHGKQTTIWTSMPGIIVSFNAGAQTAVVQLAITATVENENAAPSNMKIAVISDVPVEFPSGGGYTLTFPVAAGDECMVDFCARCIDSWWQSSGVQNPVSARIHDLSDAVCRVGVRSKPRAVGGISTSSVQLRSDDGGNYVEIAGSNVNIVGVAEINLTAPAITLTAPSVTINASSTVQFNCPAVHMSGDLHVAGTIGH